MNVQNTIVVNSNFSGQFGGMTFWVNGTGDPCVTYKVGADTVSKNWVVMLFCLPAAKLELQRLI